MQQKLKHFSALDLVEGVQLGHAAAALLQLGVLDAMREPVVAEALSRTYKIDLEMLSGVLDFLSLRTDLIRKTRSGYATGKGYTGQTQFMLSLYAGAYGKSASQLGEILRRPSTAAAAINQHAFTKAFSGAATESVGTLPTLLRQLGFNHILDIGCGAAALLCAMGDADATFVGWGIDQSAEMCRAARGSIRRAGIARRVKIFEGDAKNPLAAIPEHVRGKVRTITACNFCNELFRSDTSQFVRWLRRIRKTWPGRMLVVSDYYGRLGHSIDLKLRETFLHDYVQVISGQGVPPPNAAGWNAAYSAVGCSFVHAIEDRGSSRFVHVVRLSESIKK